MNISDPWLLALALGYLLGSIPFGLLLTRAFGVGDIRNIGSGNIGATNVLRSGRKGLAAATLLLDMGKGAGAVLMATLWWQGAAWVGLCAGFGALIGHCYPVWLGFRGGKGVATMLGVSFGLDGRIGLAAALTWLVVARVTRMSSLGGMASAVAAPLAAVGIGLTTDTSFFLGGFVRAAYFLSAIILTPMALLVIWKHRANIARLRAGTEPRIGARP